MKQLWPLLAFAIACALLWMQVVLSAQNTLFLHPEWRVEKRTLQVSPMGADQFLITRAPLANKMLHLGAWFGAQGLTWRRALEPTDMDFRFRLAPGAQRVDPMMPPWPRPRPEAAPPRVGPAHVPR
jgi:hypothetical protein